MLKIPKNLVFSLIKPFPKNHFTLPPKPPPPSDQTPTYDKLVNDYVQDINKTSTDFKNEFGFVDNLNDLRANSKKKDLNFYVSFSSIWMCLCAAGKNPRFFTSFSNKTQRNFFYSKQFAERSKSQKGQNFRDLFLFIEII